MTALLAILAALLGCGGGTSGSSADGVTGKVVTSAGSPLGGVMVTAYDQARFSSVSVYTAGDGRYHLPPLTPGSYQVWARLVGFDRALRDNVRVGDEGVRVDFELLPTSDLNAQLPASYFYSLLDWPSPRVRGDFSRACANCHQIGDGEWRESRTEEEWEELVDEMIRYGGVPFFAETRPVLLSTILRVFGPNAVIPSFPVPPAPSGDSTRVIIREWELDPDERPGCHDLELDEEGRVYTVGGLWILDPKTGERAYHRVPGGGHSVERDRNGDMWITAPGPEQIIKFDVETLETTHYDQPRIGEDLGSYPHTLRFDDQDRIWYTLTRSNHVAMFDPATAEFTYYRLPDADPAVSGVPIAVAYGCDVAPDQTVWWSQLFGHRIGRIDPETGEVSSWNPPFDGPRRLRVGPDNIVWVPGYGQSVLGRFDPVTESWKVYPLPTEPAGSELPYALAVNHDTGDVWITGSNSDTLIRFRPETEEFTRFFLPTPVDFTREIEFGPDGSIWTCTSRGQISADRPGTGRVLQLELLERTGRCGDSEIQLGEECDDGNSTGCDGCSAACRVETGCGDGSICGSEECDDGGIANCDGCSATCRLETGFVCGDGEVNAMCGEECDPPGPTCHRDCSRLPDCGDGILDSGEECDDGDHENCDGCSEICTVETGCGDGSTCGSEQCDDGNQLDCDGCASMCLTEPGGICGDGVIDPTCGEECDPPGSECSFDCRASIGPLGTRPFSFGGNFYSSALGTSSPLGELTGFMEIDAGLPDAEGRALLTIDAPVIFSAPILGGTYGVYCVRLENCQGVIDCDGGTLVDTDTSQDSAGPGAQGEPVVLMTGLGLDGGRGAAELVCSQSFVQLPPGGDGNCFAAEYPGGQPVAYTTGTATAAFENGAPKVGSGAIELSGENFRCESWTREDGEGRLVGAFLVEEDSQAGDVANVTLLDD